MGTAPIVTVQSPGPETTPSYLVAGSQPRNRLLFDQRIRKLPGTWVFVDSPQELSVDRLCQIDPRYVFFLHWNWIVPTAIHDRWECVVFHMTDVPYGRGGSPLQNLMIRGHEETVLSAIRMTNNLDAGPVYLKQLLQLDGSAEEIYCRTGQLSVDMMIEIIDTEPEPVPRVGEVTLFTRRTPDESQLSVTIKDLRDLDSFIRMLDADGYPAAFLCLGDKKIEFRDSSLQGDRIIAKVEITNSVINGEDMT